MAWKAINHRFNLLLKLSQPVACIIILALILNVIFSALHQLDVSDKLVGLSLSDDFLDIVG